MVKTMKEAAIAAARHAGAVREIKFDLAQFLHARLEGTKLILAVPVHDGPMFDQSYADYLAERYGQEFADRTLDAAAERFLRAEIVERLLK